ncbi:hypothetical protein [Nocardia sp. XZ_19_231]|uniref:hypothetical protein n=1 Tax=Nocardia sp. XZ_19_231 TaxID=2769252 RepID=UPI00188F8C43|nr:hypothetical protein [Nocardia sp. XZ_19_231]
MSVPVASHNAEPMPRPTPPNTDLVAVLALAFSVSTLTMLLTSDNMLAVTVWGVVMGASWNPNGRSRK